jgi:hypothetical protein
MIDVLRVATGCRWLSDPAERVSGKVVPGERPGGTQCQNLVRGFGGLQVVTSQRLKYSFIKGAVT